MRSDITRSDISIKQLRYFVASAETGQFSMAAAKLFVTQSAITAAIQGLEARLGVTLFDRLPHGVMLTTEGHGFLQHARRVLDALNDALNEPRHPRHQLNGSIRIAASYTVQGYFLPPLLARFRAHHPDVDFELRDLERADIETAVEQDQIELGVLILSNVSQRERFGHHVLMRSRRQLWAAAGHPVLQTPYPALADIAPHPYLMLTVDEVEPTTHRYWAEHGLQPHVGYRTQGMEALRGLVAHGFGVTILGDMVYRPWSLEGRKIEARPILDAVPHLEVGLIWRHGRSLDRAADAMRQFLIRVCGA